MDKKYSSAEMVRNKIDIVPIKYLQYRVRFLQKRVGKNNSEIVTDERLLKLINQYKHAISKLLEGDKLNFET